jgi:hypothetical protein
VPCEENSLQYKKKFERIFKEMKVLYRGGQPAAQNKFLRPKLEFLKLAILDVFLQFFGVLRPKISTFLANFPSFGPQTNLGWPPLVLYVQVCNAKQN